MAPPDRPHDFRRDLPPPRRAGVLLLLYPRPRELFFVLMRRTERSGVHSGQISFPGGRWEPGDADLTATALRETNEELGVALDRVQVLGPLTELYIPPSHFLVSPTVAYIDHAPEFHPQPSEVAEVIEAPIEILSDPAVRGESPRPLASQGGKITATPHFRIGGHLVWGATAMILCEFEAAVAQA